MRLPWCSSSSLVLSSGASSFRIASAASATSTLARRASADALPKRANPSSFMETRRVIHTRTVACGSSQSVESRREEKSFTYIVDTDTSGASPHAARSEK